MRNCPHGPYRHWMRHTAFAPKGFLRYYVLELLKEKPMSGSEIMEEIEKQMGGRWRPSPGSVYPLLSWLQDNGYVKEQKTEESGIKRYSLTDQGRKLLEEQPNFREEMGKRMEFFSPPFFKGFYRGRHHQEMLKSGESIRRIIRAVLDLRMVPEEQLSEQSMKEIAEILDNAAGKIEAISKKTKRKESEQ